MGKTLAEKWAQVFRVEGGQWPEDGHWPEHWYAIEQENKTLEIDRRLPAFNAKPKPRPN